MSIYHYLRCDAHDPPLYSENVGQHLYDLPFIRDLIVQRAALADTEPTWQWDDAHGWWQHNAIIFFREHPTCPVSIEDEYGEEHPTEGDNDD